MEAKNKTNSLGLTGITAPGDLIMTAEKDSGQTAKEIREEYRKADAAERTRKVRREYFVSHGFTPTSPDYC